VVGRNEKESWLREIWKRVHEGNVRNQEKFTNKKKKKRRQCGGKGVKAEKQKVSEES